MVHNTPQRARNEEKKRATSRKKAKNQSWVNQISRPCKGLTAQNRENNDIAA